MFLLLLKAQGVYLQIVFYSFRLVTLTVFVHNIFTQIRKHKISK